MATAIDGISIADFFGFLNFFFPHSPREPGYSQKIYPR